MLILVHELLLEFSETPIVCMLEAVNVLVIIGKLNFLSNYRIIGPGFHAALRLLNLLVLLLHALSIPRGGLHRLVAGYSLDPVDDIALNVLAHVLVLVADCAISDGARWSSAPRLIVFDFLDHLVVLLTVSVPPRTVVAHFDVGREAGAVNEIHLPATDDTCHSWHLVEVRGAWTSERTGGAIIRQRHRIPHIVD